MNHLKRLLAATAAAGLLVGLGATQALALTPFSATVLLACATVGQTQKITVQAGGDAVVHIEVTINNSTVNGGTQNGTGPTDGNHNFTDQWAVAAVQASTTATVRIWVLTANGVGSGRGTFDIHPVSAPCPTTASVSIAGELLDTTQVGGSVKKTCDPGVTGNATFTATIQIRAGTQLLTTVSVPVSLTLACNGAAKALPVLPPTSVITLHEVTLPAGAAALAADTKITVGTTAVTTTIHNAKVVVLPATGHPASIPSIPWAAMVLLGLAALGGAGLILRRRS